MGFLVDNPNSPPPPSPLPRQIKMNLINTSSGDPLTLTGTLKRSWSPNGYDHFLNLISDSYYTNSPFFRVIPGFIAQFGLNPDPKVTEKYKKSIQDDPKGTGIGNKKVSQQTT